MKSMDLWLVLFGFLGVFAQEVMHWFDLKQELGVDVKITKSLDYWIITIVSIIVFGLATAVISSNFFSDLDHKNSLTIATGFAFPSVIKVLAKVVLKMFNSYEETPRRAISSFTIKNYFKIY